MNGLLFFLNSFHLTDIDDDPSTKHTIKSGLQEHFLGWALFLAWIDLTIILARFDLFGRHIYRSFYVIKNVAWSMSVYLPSLIAFAFGFHCFLRNDPIFEGPTASILKTFAMVLGEFNIEGRFLYDHVAEVDGSNVSVQILFISFLIYGSVIIMNLITAWIFVNEQDVDSEIILAQQRIEEITGVTEIFSCCKREKYRNNVPPTLVVMPVSDKTAHWFMSFLR